MINTGKCPGCSKTLTYVKIEGMDIKQGFQSAFHGVSFLCPSCHVVLSVGIDPIALKADVVDEVVEKLKKGY